MLHVKKLLLVLIFGIPSFYFAQNDSESAVTITPSNNDGMLESTTKPAEVRGDDGGCPFDPVITITPPDDDGIFCPGDVITLTTIDAEAFQWFYNFNNANFGGVAVAEGNVQSIDVSASEWAVVYFYVECTIDGCTEASPTVVWDSWVFNSPAIEHPALLTYCEGEEIIISNAFPGPSIFQWYLNGNEIVGATGESYVVTESGTYVLEVAYPDCPNFLLSSGVGPTFTFLSVATPTISQTVNVLQSSTAVTYSWALNGDGIDGATEQDYSATESGSYTVTITDANGCSATSDPFDFVLVGIESVELSDLKLFPNPTSDQLNIQSDGKAIGTISIVDSQGIVVLSNYFNSDLATIDVRHLSPGMYTAVLDKYRVSHTFTIQK